MPHTEAPFSINFKPAEGFDAPMLTIRADSAAELSQKLSEIEAAGIYAQVGGAHHAYKAAYQMADQLGAQHMSTGMQTPEVVQQVQQQAPQGYTPPAPNAQPAYQQPAQPTYPQQQAPGGYAAAGTPVPPPAQPTPGSIPGAPMTPFGPAKFVQSKPGAPKPWQAWADPRPASQTDHIQIKTDDPNDPRLAAGQAKLWAFVR